MSDHEQTSHDQNFKNLLLDFVHEALRFFGGAEGEDIPDNAVITPLRQEQLKGRLAQGHHEVDTSLLVELPNGEREAIVFLIEEETEPRHFSLHRLAHYLLDLAELHGTERIVPIVIFLRKGDSRSELKLGTERAKYLWVTYIGCHLARMNALEFLNSRNIVARILLPCMASPEERRVEVIMRAFQGVVSLEANVHKQRKYTEFVSMYAGLNPQQRVELEQALERAPWSRKMTGWLGEAAAKGKVEGKVEGKAELVLRSLALRGLRPSATQKKLVLGCTDETQLDAWFDRAFAAKTVGAVFDATSPARKRPKRS
jgi:hypothetical protein